jgi:poly [ADP-ribose] polymerase
MTTEERLIFTDLANNNNKFWHAKIDGTKVNVNFGRVGDTGQFKTYNFTDEDSAQRKFASDVRSKLNKGYTRQQTISNGVPNVAFVAKVQIQHQNDPETTALIDFLVKRNIHAIEGATSIRMEAGKLTTPLGPVTSSGLDQAEILLSTIERFDKDFEDAVNKYLRIVPRDFGRRKIDPHDIFGTPKQIVVEKTVLDSLRAVVKDLEQKSTTDGPPIFETKLEILDASDKDFAKISSYFHRSLNQKHQSARMTLHRAWKMNIDHADKNFNDTVGNVKNLWHGTKDSNLLSILKNGYIIPKRNSGIAITGRMFGDGIYFSDQSTKALNYASGFWGGSSSQRSFMLLNDVAMGREYIPTRSFSGTVPKGYDSCFAQANKSGVMNNEMIIYNANQVRPTFLCEFK